MATEFFTMKDSKRLPVLIRECRGSAAGFLLAMHGLAGCSNDFDPLHPILDELHLHLIAPEMRGQGRDPIQNQRGHIISRNQWCEDLGTVWSRAHQLYPGLPGFLEGESMGALVVFYARALGLIHPAPNGTILTSPVVAPPLEPKTWQLHLAHAVNFLFPGVRLNPLWFVNKQQTSHPITRDPQRLEWLKQHGPKLEKMSVRFLHELGRMVMEAWSTTPYLTEPTLIFAAGHDCFVQPAAMRRWFEKLPEGSRSFHLFPDACHLLLWDPHTPTVLEVQKTWLRDLLKTEHATSPPSMQSNEPNHLAALDHAP